MNKLKDEIKLLENKISVNKSVIKANISDLQRQIHSSQLLLPTALAVSVVGGFFLMRHRNLSHSMGSILKLPLKAKRLYDKFQFLIPLITAAKVINSDD